MSATTHPIPDDRLTRLDAGTYRAEDVARLLNVSIRQVWRMLDANRLPAAIRIGRVVRWPRKLFDDWISAGCPTPPKRSR